MPPRCLTVATSDSGGGAGIQADLKAFAALGCHGSSALVAVTAQNTVAVTRVHELPRDVIVAQLEAVYGDIGVDAAKTGMLFSAAIIETVADFLRERPGPLVVDPVMVAASGARLLQEEAVGALVRLLFPLAAVVTPNLLEACVLAGVEYSEEADREELAERIASRGASAVIVTGGHGSEAVDWLFDGRRHVPIPVERYGDETTHGAGCTHSASLAALLARGEALEDAARRAAELASEAVRAGYSLGAGAGPVDALSLAALRAR
ncbi:MAG: bifunctional hydroxymethylpyrimidine kinase/phosphomethylpyrimidine kinase [Thermoleophilia bacterium]|nr:bifunctional hydroxymethylpyrimidine kinase/phosphomethylpyrimidine kinase [Thermoleophilia bacterium]